MERRARGVTGSIFTDGGDGRAPQRGLSFFLAPMSLCCEFTFRPAAGCVSLLTWAGMRRTATLLPEPVSKLGGGRRPTRSAARAHRVGRHTLILGALAYLQRCRNL